MSLEDALRCTESARAELQRARNQTPAWNDRQRHELDTQRLDPLTKLSADLSAAIVSAQEACERAARLQAD